MKYFLVLLIYTALAALNIFVPAFALQGVLNDVIYDVGMAIMVLIAALVVVRIDEDEKNKSFWGLIFWSSFLFLVIRVVKIYILGYLIGLDKGIIQYMNAFYIIPLVVIAWAMYKDIRSYNLKLTKMQYILLALVALAFVAGTWFVLRPSIVENGASLVTIITCAIMAMFGTSIVVLGGILVIKMSGGKLQTTVILLLLGLIFMTVSQIFYIRDTLKGLGTAVNSPVTLVFYYLFGAFGSMAGLSRLKLLNDEVNLGKSVLE